MKAAVFKHYGSPEEVVIEERPMPTIGAHDILIQVVATVVNSGDWRIRSLSVPRGFGPMLRLYFGLCKPRKQILGSELAGRVTAIGQQVSQFKVGDDVIAFSGVRLGAHAEYIALPEDAPIIPKPERLDWHQAAAFCFGGTTALDFLCHKGGLEAGERVLINGASGTVGTAAIQIAKHYGAHVTAVCSAEGDALVRSIGADEVIDYRRADFTESAEQWNIIMDIVGNAPWSRSKASLKPKGRLLMIVADLRNTLLASFHKDAEGRQAIAGTAREHRDDLKTLAKLVDTNEYWPIVHKVYDFNDIRAAHEMFDQGGKHGSLVIRLCEMK